MTNIEDIHEGDLIEAVKGESVVRGRLNQGTEPYSKRYRYVGDFGDVDYYIRQGFTVTVLEKAAPPPPLPTVPGYYTADLGRILWQLGIGGDWYYVGNEWRPVAAENTQEPDGKYALTRLEPVPVTVQKVIELLESTKIIQSDGEVARSIREIFGVS